MEVLGGSTVDGADIGQGDGTRLHQRQVVLKPLLAGEPHALTFAHATDDAACGECGKQTSTGRDMNPFIGAEPQSDASQVRVSTIPVARRDPSLGRAAMYLGARRASR